MSDKESFEVNFLVSLTYQGVVSSALKVLP